MSRVGVSFAMLVSAATLAVPSAEPSLYDRPLCPLVVHQMEARRAERDRDIAVADSRLRATGDIFALVDRLWADEAVDRTAYLTARHERDVAAVERERQAVLRERDDAELDHVRTYCAAGDHDRRGRSERDPYAATLRAYLRLDCVRLGKELVVAELDLDYSTEILASVRDLRSNDVATRQDVIRAELQVDVARTRVEHYEARVEACTRATGTGGPADVADDPGPADVVAEPDEDGP